MEIFAKTKFGSFHKFRFIKTGINFILGVNGVGKTYLCREIAEKTKSYLITPEFDCDEDLTVGLFLRIPFYDKFWRLEKGVEEKIFKIMNKYQIRDLEAKPISKISLGQKLRVQIALSEIKDCEVLIFDEPTSGLDRDGLEQLFESLKNSDVIKIVTTHDFNVAKKYGSRFIGLPKSKDSVTVEEMSAEKFFSNTNLSGLGFDI